MKNKGFTLVELLTVIAIIGIMTAVVYPSLSGIRAKSRDTRRLSDLGQIQYGLAVYLSKNNSYPTDLSQLGPAPAGNNYFPAPAGLPADPKTGNPYGYAPTGVGSNTGYCLGAEMETSQYIMTSPPCSVGSANYTVKK